MQMQKRTKCKKFSLNKVRSIHKKIERSRSKNQQIELNILGQFIAQTYWNRELPDSLFFSYTSGDCTEEDFVLSVKDVLKKLGIHCKYSFSKRNISSSITKTEYKYVS